MPGLDHVKVVTYEDIWTLNSLPKRLTVIGGGPIGVELAQAMSRLGSMVTIVATQLLPREDPEVSQVLQQVLEEGEEITVMNGRLPRRRPAVITVGIQLTYLPVATIRRKTSPRCWWKEFSSFCPLLLIVYYCVGLIIAIS
jgi:hypothetical protein